MAIFPSKPGLASCPWNS